MPKPASLGRSTFELMADQAPVLIWISGADRLCTWFNQTWLTFVGRSLAQEVGEGWVDNVHPEDRADVVSVCAEAFAARRPFDVEYRLRRHDGVYRWMLARSVPHFGDDGVFKGYIGTCTDISQRIAAEQRVRELNTDLTHRLEEQTALLAALPVGVFIARDAACTQMTMNEAGARMLRISPTTNPSKTGPAAPSLPFRVFQDGRELAPSELIMQRASQIGQSIHGVEVDMVFGDGSCITLHESASPLFDESGRVRGCVAVFVDITERKQSERQKSLLIDELNHRVKNTLSIVQSIANQTLRLTPKPETFTAAFTSRLAALARTHALLTQSSWEGSCLDSLLSCALSPFEIDARRIVIAGPPVSVRSSIAVTLSLVLHELATNAVKHGALSTHDGKLAVSWDRDGDTVRLRWKEMNGPPVGAARRRGFGSRLIAASADQLGGSIDLDYAPRGLTATLVLTP